MKPLLVLAIAAVSVLFTGCETGSSRDANTKVITQSIGMPTVTGDLVHFIVKRVDDHTFDIWAFGDAHQTDQQYLAAWVRMADRLAAGRPYEKQVTIEPAQYSSTAFAGNPTEFGVGTVVKGRIILK